MANCPICHQPMLSEWPHIHSKPRKAAHLAFSLLKLPFLLMLYAAVALCGTLWLLVSLAMESEETPPN